MSLWGKVRALFGGDGASPRAVDAAAEPAPAPEPPRDNDRLTDRLGELGRPGGPGVEEAIGLLRRARGTAREATAVGAAIEAASARPVAEEVRVACAEILAARGEEASALRVLEGVRCVAGLVLAADLHAATGQLARAVGTIERVLARDIAAPGAVERHRRWTTELGGASSRPRAKDEATIVAATPKGGPFRVLREAARGGAGAVYEAEDEVLGRRTAFKIYHRRDADRAALEREVAATVELAGPGVVRVFDASPSEGWIAFEWVALGSVRDVLRSGDLEVLQPVGRWAVPLARALARVHRRGWVHADVKPANILLRSGDEPVLGDLGLARLAGAPAEGGSAGYLSPERLAGRPSDARDDVYGYGRILEDVIERLDPAVGFPEARSDLASWRALALSCMGPDVARPADGAAVVRALTGAT